MTRRRRLTKGDLRPMASVLDVLAMVVLLLLGLQQALIGNWVSRLLGCVSAGAAIAWIAVLALGHHWTRDTRTITIKLERDGE
jgi:hypothetical protein